VSGTLGVARTHLVTALRERVTLFWFLVFPVFLLVLLSAVFGRIGEQGGVQFEITVIDLDRGQLREFSDLVLGLFSEMAAPPQEGGEPLFLLTLPPADADPVRFLDEERRQLQRGGRAAVVVIPDGFSRAVTARLGGLASGTGDAADDAAKLRIHYSQGTVASEMAAAIIEQMLAGVDREILRRFGALDEERAIRTETTWVGGGDAETSYIDFLLPGIILMGFFTNGLFGIPGSILFARDRRVLRRYWVTPLGVPRYLLGLSIGHLALCALQFGLIFGIGRFALGASVSFRSPAAVAFLALAAATFTALGFLIASLARTGHAGMAIANVLNMPLMFLSGLFFPIAGLPAALVAIIRANPLTYLGEGLRAAVGVEAGTTSTLLLVGVPLLWIAVSSAIAVRKLRWDVAR